MRRALIPLFAIFLVSCATANGASSDAYRAGYTDGCQSGNAAADAQMFTAKKDEQGYRQNGEYRRGWDEGYSSCKARMSGMGG